MKNILIEFRQEWELTDEAVEIALRQGKIYECTGGHTMAQEGNKIFHCYGTWNNLTDIGLIIRGEVL